MDAHGGQHSAPMLALFERYLDGPAAAGADEDTYDRVREGLVVLLGTLARHLPPQDPKVQLQCKLPHSNRPGVHLLGYPGYTTHYAAVQISDWRVFFGLA